MVLKDNPNWTLIFDWPRKPEKVNKNISRIGLFVRGVEWTRPLSYETNALYIFVLAIFIIYVFNSAGALVGKSRGYALNSFTHSTPFFAQQLFSRLQYRSHFQYKAKLHYTSCLDGVWIKMKKVWINPNNSHDSLDRSKLRPSQTPTNHPLKFFW